MNKKGKNILLIITITFLIVIVFGATYAYFVAQTGAGQSANINITANTTDSLMFEVGKDLNINITQANFGEGAGNQSDSTTAKAILLANNKTNTASYNYYLYLNITKNEFVYTTEQSNPEILLQITKPDGTTLTSLEGLNYVTVGSTSGFDITTKKGPITIADSRLIEVLESNTPHKTEEEWQIGITFVNLDTNQQANTNKSFASKVMIQKDPIPTISTLCKGKNMAECIKENYELDNTIYYHNESLANGAGDNSYRYAGGDQLILDESVFASRLVEGLVKVYYYKNDSQRENIERFLTINEKAESERTEEENTFYSEFNTKFNNGEIDLFLSATAAQADAKTKGITLNNQQNYINNFVCFGTDADTCPTENLYRVIGVFEDKVKLIKYDYAKTSLLGTDGDNGDAGGFASNMTDANLASWGYKGTLKANEIGLYMYNYNGLEDKTINNGWGSNDWNSSLLNTVNLNTNFLNNIGNDWSSKIATTTWSIGGVDYDTYRNQNVKAFYDIEQNKSKTYEAKVGLMYPSEYGYSAEPSYWTKELYNYEGAQDDSWMNMKVVDWTLAPRSGTSDGAFGVGGGGGVDTTVAKLGVPVRPSFSLISETVLAGGSGSMTDPWRIA